MSFSREGDMDPPDNSSSGATYPKTVATAKKQKSCYKDRALLKANSFMPDTKDGSREIFCRRLIWKPLASHRISGY